MVRIMPEHDNCVRLEYTSRFTGPTFFMSLHTDCHSVSGHNYLLHICCLVNFSFSGFMVKICLVTSLTKCNLMFHFTLSLTSTAFSIFQPVRHAKRRFLPGCKHIENSQNNNININSDILVYIQS